MVKQEELQQRKLKSLLSELEERLERKMKRLLLEQEERYKGKIKNLEETINQLKEINSGEKRKPTELEKNGRKEQKKRKLA